QAIVLVNSIPTPTPTDLEEYDSHIEGNYVFLGDLNSDYNEQYGVHGKIYEVNCTTIFVKDFSYDGSGIRVHWVVGNRTEIEKHSSNIIIPDETGSSDRILRSYDNETFYLSFPVNKSLLDVKWLSFFCTSFNLNLGSIILTNDYVCGSASYY
ncbi:unnamed protein product, partial [Meganyctiphanes norvegica]